jgi:hypothetical protein
MMNLDGKQIDCICKKATPEEGAIWDSIKKIYLCHNCFKKLYPNKSIPKTV